ncbi:hypothetical protein PROFUN_01882 [Planoprotostelium fungivorum]|uniref:Uncharacterized protein n=1 Tax=Planoprotostelium fungivorum TaxID=1890364 RepID=A0A2P6NYZ2_9EUKA|nr:hypothetical protein PROFUN_01882 [Planoprotostelium fungivorum]
MILTAKAFGTNLAVMREGGWLTGGVKLNSESDNFLWWELKIGSANRKAE